MGYSSADTLTVDLTPWWWTREWGRASPEVERAFLYVRHRMTSIVEQIAVSRLGVQVVFEVSSTDDIARLQLVADEVRLSLDEFVKLDDVVASEA